MFDNNSNLNTTFLKGVSPVVNVKQGKIYSLGELEDVFRDIDNALCKGNERHDEQQSKH